MARKVRTVVAKPVQDVYVGMLLVSVATAFLSVALLAYEWSEYDFTSEAKSGPAINLPKDVGPRTASPATADKN